MKPDSNDQQLRLKKREAELKRMITQMKSDELDQSNVFKQLEEELTTLKTALENN